MVSLDYQGFLTQLGYAPNDAMITKMQNVVANTPGFEDIEKHIIQLNDTLKHQNSIVAVSNSHDYFKIKNNATADDKIAETEEIIQKWATKYKVNLKKVSEKETFYILGKNND